MLFGLLAVTPREAQRAESKLMIFQKAAKPGVKEGSMKPSGHTMWLCPNSLKSKDR